MCSVIEGKKPRLVKYAKLALLEIKKTIGDAKFEVIANSAFYKNKSETEEGEIEIRKLKYSKTLIDGLELKNFKEDKSKNFRFFLKNQKTKATEDL